MVAVIEHSQVRVAIVEDDVDTLHLLSQEITKSHATRLVFEADSYDSARAMLASNEFDVVLLDIDLAGRSSLPLIPCVGERARVLIMTVFEDEATVCAAIALGAQGYLVKGDPAMPLVQGVVQVAQGHAPISPSVAGYLLNHMRDSADPMADGVALSTRETEVLTLLARGFTYDQTAQECGIAYSTVAFHVRQIYEKLRVGSKAEAVYEALQQGLIRLS